MGPLIPVALQLAQFAPSLMRFFGAGETSAAVAEQVVGLAQTVSGTKSPEDALAALKQSTELQGQFNLRSIELDAQLEQAHLVDRQNARARDVEMIKAGIHNKRADVMVAIDGAGLIICLVVLVFFRQEMPGEVVGLISTIASIFGLCLRDAHQFEFGTSRSSREKDQLLYGQPRSGA